MSIILLKIRKNDMNRFGNLYDKIYYWNNLVLGFYKASLGKKDSLAVKDYSNNLYKNLFLLKKQFENVNICVGNYYFFRIYDPKERLICAASFSERVLHHCIMNICEEAFDSFQIFDSYACRKGKGTKKAVYRAFYFAKKFKYCIKLDMKKYFDSISHQKLNELLSLRFKDKRLLKIFKDIIDSYSVCDGRGIPIGNLTSQYFANFYLAFFDHYSKEVLGIKGYVRYMDDILIFANSIGEVHNFLSASKDYISNFLLLECKKEIIFKTNNGVSFLGFLVSSSGICFTSQKKKRIKKRLKEYEGYLRCGIISQKEFADRSRAILSVRSWLVSTLRHTVPELRQVQLPSIVEGLNYRV